MQRFHLLLWPNSKARGQHLTIQPLLATVKHFIHIFLFTYLSHTTCLFYSPPLTPQNPHYPIQALQDTPLHPNGSITTKQLAQLWIASPWTNQSFNFFLTPLHTLVSKCLNSLNHLFIPGLPDRHLQHRTRMGNCMGSRPRTFQKSQRTCNNPFIQLLHHPHQHLIHQSQQHFPFYQHQHLLHSFPHHRQPPPQ